MIVIRVSRLMVVCHFALPMVREWIEIHQTELLEMWQTQEFKKIDPLV